MRGDLSEDVQVEIKRASQEIATGIGLLLRQEIHEVSGAWWLFTLGNPIRVLTSEEVEWHTVRGHAPFVAGGLEPGDPRWWDDP